MASDDPRRHDDPSPWRRDDPPGDRVVVIGSPRAARAWSELLWPGGATVRDVVVYGAGRVGTAIARVPGAGHPGAPDRGDMQRRARVAEELPQARVYNADGIDPDFIERERLGEAQVAVFAMRDDAKNLFAATLAKVHGISFTIAIVHEPVSRAVYEQARRRRDRRSAGGHGGGDRPLRARPPHPAGRDARGRPLRGTRHHVRPASEYTGKQFRDMPIRGALIGAIVRNGEAIFPHGDDVLEAGDRVIIFTESARVPTVEKALRS